MAVTGSDLGRPVRIYLCGSVKKGLLDNRSEEEFWDPAHEIAIAKALDRPVELLNPSKTKIRRSNYFINFGCDIFLVQSSDLLFADLRSEKGIGVGAELMFARQAGIPVIAWLPPDSHYRRDLTDVFGEDLHNWVHPFAYALSDYIEDSLNAVCERAKSILAGEVQPVMRNKEIKQATDAFLREYPDFER